MVTPKSPLLPHLLILAPPAATTFLLFEHTDKLLVRAWDGCCLRLECFSPRHLCDFILLSASSLRSSLSLNEVILTTTGKVTTTHPALQFPPILVFFVLFPWYTPPSNILNNLFIHHIYCLSSVSCNVTSSKRGYLPSLFKGLEKYPTHLWQTT